MIRRVLCAVLGALFMVGVHGAAAGDRLAWTGGVTEVEGSAGGGLVPWALIAGLATDDQVGGTAFSTYVSTGDFTLRSEGLGIGAGDRVEVSWARQRLDAGSVLPGLTLGQDIVGAKVRVAGDAVFAPDCWLPQLAIGAQWKRTLDFANVPRALGAASGQDVDLYIAATKLYFAAIADRNLLLDVTLRRTRANQFGLLGFGSNEHSYQLEPEASAVLFVTEVIGVGTEYRAKPENLRPLREDAAQDAFIAWGPSKHVSITLAWLDLGRIATKPAQRGVYLSLSAGI